MHKSCPVKQPEVKRGQFTELQVSIANRSAMSQLLSNQLQFSIPPDPESWPRRIEAACSVLESVFPGERLHLAASYSANRQEVVLTDRPKYLRAKLKTRTRWFNLSNGKAHVGCGDDVRDEGLLSLGGGGYSVSVLFPQCPYEVCEALIVALGDALEAHFSQWSPWYTFLWLRHVQWGHWTSRGLELPSHSLPRLEYQDIALAEEHPDILGWLNYWSPRACEHLGFAEAQLDSRFKSCSYRTPAGAWLVKLGLEALDYRIAEHRHMLATAYEQFPLVGVRRGGLCGDQFPED